MQFHPHADHARLERALLLALAVVAAYGALAYFVLPAIWIGLSVLTEP